MVIVRSMFVFGGCLIDGFCDGFCDVILFELLLVVPVLKISSNKIRVVNLFVPVAKGRFYYCITFILDISRLVVPTNTVIMSQSFLLRLRRCRWNNRLSFQPSAVAAFGIQYDLSMCVSQGRLGCFSFSTKSDAAAATDSAKLGIPYNQLSIGIPKEIYDKECRVAATPETTLRFLKANFKQVYVEENAGVLSKFNNQAYETAGATIVPNVWKDSDIVLKVR